MNLGLLIISQEGPYPECIYNTYSHLQYGEILTDIDIFEPLDGKILCQTE